MTILTTEPNMPRRPAEKPKRNDVVAKLDADVVRKAKIVAAFRGQSLAELLSDILAPVVDRMLDEEITKQAKTTRKKT